MTLNQKQFQARRVPTAPMNTVPEDMELETDRPTEAPVWTPPTLMDEFGDTDPPANDELT